MSRNGLKEIMTHLIDVALPTSMHPETHTLAKNKVKPVSVFQCDLVECSNCTRLMITHVSAENQSKQLAGWIASIFLY